MSRCFPFPPPGYARNGVRDEALIESIKREAEISRKERREDKKRRKKEKKLSREDGESSEKKHSHKRKHRDKSLEEDGSGGDYHKKQRTISKLSNKSTLTEEHGQPGSSQNSTDSTLNISKGQQTPPSLTPEIKQGSSESNPNTSIVRQTSPSLYLEGKQRSASIIRIQLPQQRQKGPEMMPSREQPSLSAPGRKTMSNASLAPSQGQNMNRNSSLAASQGPSMSKNGILAVSQGRTMSNNVPRTSSDKLASQKPSSSVKGRESSAPGKAISNASMASSKMNEPVPRTNGVKEVMDNPCSTYSLKGQEPPVPGRKISNGSMAASRACTTIPRTEKSCSTSSIQGRESSPLGRNISHSSLPASQVGRFVPQSSSKDRAGPEKPCSTSSLIAGESSPLRRNTVNGVVSQTSGVRTGQEQSSVPGRTISKASLVAPQRRGNAIRSSPNYSGQEQSFPLGRTTENITSAPDISKKVSHSGGKSVEPLQLPSASSLDSRDFNCLKPGKEEKDPSPSSDAAVAGTSAPVAETSSSPSSRIARPSKSEIKYAKLMENWVPPCLHNSSDDTDDQEWLFQKKLDNDQNGNLNKQGEAKNGGLESALESKLGPMPRVCFLPEADIYALPYTVPY